MARWTEEDVAALLARTRGENASASGSISEEAFQADIIAAAKKLGWRCHHHYDARRSEPGWLDLVLANPRQKRVLFVELKSETGRLTDGQAWWIGALMAAGLEVYVWRPADYDKALEILSGRGESTEGR